MSKNDGKPLGKPTRATPRSKTQPRYAWLHQSLLDGITSGKYPLGSGSCAGLQGGRGLSQQRRGVFAQHRRA
jgi:hypothetical protein